MLGTGNAILWHHHSAAIPALVRFLFLPIQLGRGHDIVAAENQAQLGAKHVEWRGGVSKSDVE